MVHGAKSHATGAAPALSTESTGFMNCQPPEHRPSLLETGNVNEKLYKSGHGASLDLHGCYCKKRHLHRSKKRILALEHTRSQSGTTGTLYFFV